MYLFHYLISIVFLLILIKVLNTYIILGNNNSILKQIHLFFEINGSDILLLTLLTLSIIFYAHTLGWKFNNNGTMQEKVSKTYTFETFENNFCKTYQNNSTKLNEACKQLSKNNCINTHCCVLLDDSKCVSGDKYGPTFRSIQQNPIKFSTFCHKKKCKKINN